MIAQASLFEGARFADELLLSHPPCTPNPSPAAVAATHPVATAPTQAANACRPVAAHAKSGSAALLLRPLAPESSSGEATADGGNGCLGRRNGAERGQIQANVGVGSNASGDGGSSVGGWASVRQLQMPRLQQRSARARAWHPHALIATSYRANAHFFLA